MNQSRPRWVSQQDELLWSFLAIIGLTVLACLADGRSLNWAAANELAAVKRDGAPLRVEMATTSRVLMTLKQGETVTVSFAATTGERNWCLVTESEKGREGYVDCADLEREPPAQWRQLPPAPAGPPRMPEADWPG